MNKQTETALITGTFKQAREAVEVDPSAGEYELRLLAVKAGLSEDVAHLLVTSCVRVAKRKVVDEYRKQAANMTYFVERA